MSTYLHGVNEAQKSAITAPPGPVLIVAGPGTGKTKTLTARIVHLLESGVSPESIVALTFTNKAAREMHERVATLAQGPLPIIATFHALCLKILGEVWPDKTITFATDAERTAALKVAQTKLSQKGFTARELALKVSSYKGQAHPADTAFAKVVHAYNAALREQNLYDFDDVLLEVYKLLRDNPSVRSRLNQRFTHILIDEFQDTSDLQWQIAQLLRGSESVFVIGDPKQSIYSFRGAGEDMFGRFAADFPEHSHITLATNYRSRPEVVHVTNAIFPKDDMLAAYQTTSGRVQALQTLNEFSEADFVLQTIEQGIGGSDMLKASVDSEGRSFRDFAVLYRTHRAAKTLQQRLGDSGIPYQVVGEGTPYDQPEVQAVTTALCMVQDSAYAGRIAGLTPGQLRALLAPLDRNMPVSRLAEEIISQLHLASNDTKKKQHLGQFVSTLVRFDARPDSLTAAVSHLRKLAESEFYDPQADAVTLLTIHASKGLEFPHVLLIGAEEGILPHIRKTAPTNFDEERRLFYVAVSRAKQRLDITYAKKRGGEPAVVSRFVGDIHEAILPRTVDPHLPTLEKRLARRQQKSRQTSLF